MTCHSLAVVLELLHTARCLEHLFPRRSPVLPEDALLGVRPQRNDAWAIREVGVIGVDGGYTVLEHGGGEHA
jgi:hypothetical protein